MATPQPALYLGEVLGTQHSAAYPLETIDEARQSNGCWILNKHVDVVVLAIKLNQVCLKVLANPMASIPDYLNRSRREDISPVFCYEYQVNMKKTYYSSSPAIFCAFPVACHI